MEDDKLEYLKAKVLHLNKEFKMSSAYISSNSCFADIFYVYYILPFIPRSSSPFDIFLDL